MERNERLKAADKCASRYTDEKEKRIARAAFMDGCEFEAQGEIVNGVVLEYTPEGLDEAADEYAEKHGFRVPYDGSDNFYDDVDVKASKEGFIAGAKWQAEKDVRDMCMSDNRHFEKVYQLGKKDMKEQMMKEAVEGEIEYNYDRRGLTYYTIRPQWITGNIGDKVRIIVIPKED